jgi:LuxR family transcriptional regulator, maltose regulon positive regulatory protein
VTQRSFHVVEPSRRAGATGGVADGAMVTASMLQPPAARPGAVVRQQLLDRLTESQAAKLVLVVGPAGGGKTSLLRDWWSAGQDSGRTWLSIETAHNDPARFWSSIITAIRKVSPAAGAAALEMLTAPGAEAPACVEPLLINDLAAMPGRSTLVLDDFHLITNQEVLACFGFLVEHLPPTLGLVVATRSDPALPLARLRARGEMAEIRAGELSFSETEAAQLLNGTLGLALPPEEVHALWQRTEGWAAGLYLAGLSLHGYKDTDPSRFISGFAGDDRHIFDYLAAEVLGGLPPVIRSFLLRTCVLDRLSGSLCDAVTGSSGSQRMLEEIERSQLFLQPLDNARRWYRYHPLFAEMVRRELDQSEPGLASLLHRRASAWHRQHGPITEAIEHAIRAGDETDARELIAAHWSDVLDDGLAETVESWLDRLPPHIVAEDARMCLIRGLAAHHRGRLEDVERWLAAAETTAPMGPIHHGPTSVASGTFYLRAAYRHHIGDLAAAESASRQAADLELETGSAQWRAPALAMLGATLFWRGQDADASGLFEQVIGHADRPASQLPAVSALSCMSAIAARRGDRETAGRYLREAADVAARYRLAGSWATVTADLTSASLLADRGELTEAEAVAGAALEHARRRQARIETAAALLCLAKIHARGGPTAEARAWIGEATDLISQCPDPGILTGLLAETERLAGHTALVPEPRSPGRARRPDGLTAREAEILALLTQGCTNVEIAARLVVSVHTVERHLQNAYRKVGVRNRADAAAYMARSDGLGPGRREPPWPRPASSSRSSITPAGPIPGRCTGSCAKPRCCARPTAVTWSADTRTSSRCCTTRGSARAGRAHRASSAGIRPSMTGCGRS